MKVCAFLERAPPSCFQVRSVIPKYLVKMACFVVAEVQVHQCVEQRDDMRVRVFHNQRDGATI